MMLDVQLMKQGNSGVIVGDVSSISSNVCFLMIKRLDTKPCVNKRTL